MQEINMNIPDIPAEKLKLVHKDPSDFHEVSEVYENTSYGKDVALKMLHNRGAMVGLAMIVVIILFAMFAPVVSARAYDQVILEHNSLSPRIPVLENFGIFNGVKDGVDVYAQRGIPDDVYYYFGTDSLGRDLWTRLWSGTRLSLLIAVIAVVIDLAIGMSYGLISGYFGKKVDFLMQRFVEISPE